MDVTPLIKEGQQIIQAYAAGEFRVSSVKYNHAIIVQPHDTIEWKNVDAFKDLTLEDFQPLIDNANNIDVVLLGAGASMQFFKPKLKSELSALGLVIETMGTGAACRTYNVLMAEGRRVAAALLPNK